MARQVIDVESLDTQFSKQVSQQLQRATAELNQLEQLLKAGMVDRAVLTEFRESVNRVRNTGWAVQQTMESTNSPEDVAKVLTTERIRAAGQLNAQLTSDLRLAKDNGGLDRSKLAALAKTVDLLAGALHTLLNEDPLEL